MRALLSLIAVVLMNWANTAHARDPIEVVVSIKPVHSIAADIMKGIAEPYLLIDGNTSPHTWAMKPSQARRLQQSDLVIWIGPQIESALAKPVRTIAARARSLQLINTPGLMKLPLRGHHDHHDHDDHKHADDHDDEHAHEREHEHEHGHQEDSHGQKSAEAVSHEATEVEHPDAHIWLDPRNAVVIADTIASTLAEQYPDHAQQFRTNAAAFKKRLSLLEDELRTILAPLRSQPFVTFHDAYQYFERRFGLTFAGAITLSPENPPGARRIAELRSEINSKGAKCVLAEPQFEPAIVRTLVDGSSARYGVIDPLGASLEAGPELYDQVLRNMAAAYRDCLG